MPDSQRFEGACDGEERVTVNVLSVGGWAVYM
jgi:hypothetical protein